MVWGKDSQDEIMAEVIGKIISVIQSSPNRFFENPPESLSAEFSISGLKFKLKVEISKQ